MRLVFLFLLVLVTGFAIWQCASASDSLFGQPALNRAKRADCAKKGEVCSKKKECCDKKADRCLLKKKINPDKHTCVEKGKKEKPDGGGGASTTDATATT